MSVDPLAHGTPVGDGHTWIDPGQADCPDCECCVKRLCQKAKETGWDCYRTADRQPTGGVNLRTCPCAPTEVSDVD